MMSNPSDNRRTSGNPLDTSGPSPSRESEILKELSWVVDAWKQAVENKDWNGLSELIGLREIFVTGHPREAAAVARDVTALTADLCDFEVVLGDITHQDITPDLASFTFVVKVVWSVARDWEDQELDVLVHVGFAIAREGWSTRYILFDRAPAALTPAGPTHTRPPHSRSAAANPNAEPAHTPALPSESEPSGGRALTDDGIAEAAAQYFARSTREGAPPARGKKQLIYVPVLMDADLIRDLLS